MRDAEWDDRRANAVSCLTESTAHVKVTATAKNYWGSHALAGCGRRCATLSRWTGRRCAADSTTRHLASQTGRRWNFVLASDSRLRISSRSRALLASTRHPICRALRDVSSRHGDRVPNSLFQSNSVAWSLHQFLGSLRNCISVVLAFAVQHARVSQQQCVCHGDRQRMDLELFTVLD